MKQSHPDHTDLDSRDCLPPHGSPEVSDESVQAISPILYDCALRLGSENGLPTPVCSNDPLLAGLLIFHSRELATDELLHQQCLEFSSEDAFSHSDCIASASLVSTEDFKPGKRLVTYRFDATQPFRHTQNPERPPSLVCQNSRTKYQLLDIDSIAGFIQLIANRDDEGRIATETTLIHKPADFSRSIRLNLEQQATGWLWDNKKISAALQDLLSRKGSQAVLQLNREIRSNPQLSIELISDYLFQTDGVSLVIQGPPGSGKTACAARIISSLVASGFNVGISANSHLAINHLLVRTAIALQADQSHLRLSKFQSKISTEDAKLLGMHGIDIIEGASFDPEYDVYGGTAAAFSHDRFAGLLDLLVIDEASQVPLASLVAMSRCTRNILLVGDQQQLPQPSVAQHAGESGLSCLEYATAGEDVIPANRGIFLSKSWRMHPDLCEVVSDLFYESRLVSFDKNKSNKVVSDLAPSGLIFIPVVHEDNHIISTEEAVAISDLVDALLGRPFEIQDSGNVLRGKVGWKDIAIMAPYNAQVNHLQRTLGPQARVGTVDRFQGQEAPISIYSMTSSSVLAPRGLEFVLSSNRINVAISRAQCLAIVVGSPSLSDLLARRQGLAREQRLLSRMLDHAVTPRFLA